MKTSQKIYQQADIAKNKMAEYALAVARMMSDGRKEIVSGSKTPEELKDLPARVDEMVVEFGRWETAFFTLREIGNDESLNESGERMKAAREAAKVLERAINDARKEEEDVWESVV